MSAPATSPQELAAQAAAAAAAQQFNIEAFTLLGVGLFITILRTYTRISTVGWRRLEVDDYLIWFAALCYCAETGLAYNVGHAAKGLANNGMTPEERMALSVDSPEYGLRVLGSKIQLAGWTIYGTMLWALKASLLVFYTRLTAGMGRFYELRIYIGYGLVFVSYLVVVFNLFLGCRPLRRNWQINPDPGDTCQPAVSGQVVWVYFAMNVITDLYLLSIPLPMLWMSSLRPAKKVGLMILFGGGFLVIACATLRCVLIVTDPVNGAQLAGGWAVRETFVANVTTNLPMVYPLLTIIFGPCIGNFLSSMRSTNKHRDSAHGTKSLVSYGNDTGYNSSHKGPRSNPMTNVTFSESEERIVGVMEMNDMKDRSESGSSGNVDGSRGFNTDIQKDVEVNVVCQSRDGGDSGLDSQRQQATADLEESMRREQGNYAFARGPSLRRGPGDAV